MTAVRELADEELDLVSGGKVHKSTVAGITFTYDDKTSETTTSAGGISITTGRAVEGRGSASP